MPKDDPAIAGTVFGLDAIDADLDGLTGGAGEVGVNDLELEHRRLGVTTTDVEELSEELEPAVASGDGNLTFCGGHKSSLLNMSRGLEPDLCCSAITANHLAPARNIQKPGLVASILSHF